MSGSILTVREEWMGIAVEYRRVTLPAAPMRKQRILFFQSEDGIRDSGVTGVQTCALPIWCLVGDDQLVGVGVLAEPLQVVGDLERGADGGVGEHRADVLARALLEQEVGLLVGEGARSEERRVGKECRSRWWPYHSRQTHNV